MKSKLFILLVATTFFGCDLAPTNEELLSHAGITGEHELRHPNAVSGLSGSLNGYFLIGTGSINGKVENISKIMFSWCPKPETIISSEFPKSMFIIQIDDTKKVPTLEFLFGKDWLTDRPILIKKTEWSTHNVNAIISATGELQAIRVKISKEGLRKEPALPQM